jgi:uncharacterized protein (TIGR02271 family)
MADKKKFDIRKGLNIFGSDNQSVGTIDRFDDDYFYVGNQRYPNSEINRLEGNNLYLSGTTQRDRDDNVIYIPVVEERLNVGKREVEGGEVEIRKTVTQEQVNVPVELRHEEARLEHRNVEHRTLTPEEAAQAFKEGVFRLRLRGEEAVVDKQAVVTDEVAIRKEQIVERQNVQDTIRKEHVDIDEGALQTANNRTRTDVNYNTTNRTNNTDYATAATGTTGTSNIVGNYSREGSYRNEYTPNAYQTENYATQNFGYNRSTLHEDLDVYSADNKKIGKITELDEGWFTVGSRGFFKSDLEVNYEGVRNVEGDKVVLKFTEDQLNDVA